MSSDFFEGLMKNINVRYSEAEIMKLAITLNWSGSGTENDPVIISSNQGLPQKFAFVASSLFIKIMNCSFNYVIFSECKNIFIEHCSFETLGYIRSLYNVAKDCSISKLRLAFSINNSFTECSISKALNLASKDNNFEDCTLSDKASKALAEDFLSPIEFMKILRIGIIIAGFATVLYVFFYIFNALPLGINVILSVLIFTGFIIAFLLLKKLQKSTEK